MKHQSQFPVRSITDRVALLVFMLVMLIVSLFNDATAQGWDTDPFLVNRGHFTAGIITSYQGPSVPAPVLIAEVNYGVTNKTTIGLVGGTTGTLALLGPKLNTQIFQKNNFRIIYRMDMIYYPERNGTFLFDDTHKEVMAWMLTMGAVDTQWKSRKGIRWSIGMGFVETHCVEGMMNFFAGKHEGNLPFEVFNTVQGSVTFPLSKKFALRPEVISVWDGVKLASDDDKVRPLYIYLNLVYRF